MEKTYTYSRKIRSYVQEVAGVTKHDDGTASAWTVNWGGYRTFDNADSAFAAVKGWLNRMDACRGFAD